MLKKIQPTPAPTCPRKRGHGTRLMSRKDSATHAENRTRTVSRGGAQPVFPTRPRPHMPTQAWAWHPCCAIVLLLLLLTAGCDRDGTSIGRLKAVWGRRGISDGRLQKPRAMAIDRQDHLYIVDMTARIQVFDTDGRTSSAAGTRPTTPSANRPGCRSAPTAASGWPTPITTACSSTRPRANCCTRSAARRATSPGSSAWSPRSPTIRPATSTSPSTAISTASRSSRPRASSFVNGAATAATPASSSARRKWRSTPTTISG